MSRFYLRDVQLSIVPRSGPIRKIKSLRIKFNAKKNCESKPNTMDIEVYNLNEQSRASLEGKATSIILEAGYDGRTEVIFTGNITKFVHGKEGPDIVTKVEVADGGMNYRNAKISKGIPPGAKTKQVIHDLIEAMGLTQGAVIAIPDSQYANGITLHGLAKDRLDDVCRKNRLEWSIQDGVLQIVPEEKTTSDSVVLVSPDSGLIGSPNKTKKGIAFKTLLLPTLRPGRKVQLDSRFIKGTFKVSVVNHQGDSMSGDFFTECEAVSGIQ